MKKIFAIIAALLAITMPLTACSSSSDGYKDGSYRAEGKTADEHGWKEYLVVTVEGGEITAVEFDYSNDEGLKKSEDEEYKGYMLGAGYETYPADFTQKLEDSYLEKQKGAEVDAVAGATVSSDAFKKLAAALEDAMKKGKKDIVVVDTAAE